MTATLSLSSMLLQTPPPRARERSAAEYGLLVQARELVRVANRVDARDQAVCDLHADRGVERAAEVDPAGERAVEPHGPDRGLRRDPLEAGEQVRHALAALDRMPHRRGLAAAVG